MNDTNISYKKQGVNLETYYTIEYIDNKKDFERLEKHPEPWTLYKTKHYTDLQEAISIFVSMYARYAKNDPTIYDVKLFEEIKLNNETIQERYITDINCFGSIKDIVSNGVSKQFSSMNETILLQNAELETMQEFIKKYNAEKTYKQFNDNYNKGELTA